MKLALGAVLFRSSEGKKRNDLSTRLTDVIIPSEDRTAHPRIFESDKCTFLAVVGDGVHPSHRDLPMLRDDDRVATFDDDHL